MLLVNAVHEVAYHIRIREICDRIVLKDFHPNKFDYISLCPVIAIGKVKARIQINMLKLCFVTL